MRQQIVEAVEGLFDSKEEARAYLSDRIRILTDDDLIKSAITDSKYTQSVKNELLVHLRHLGEYEESSELNICLGCNSVAYIIESGKCEECK